jgi:methylmalonyl-CoA mutase N-terminal domain/subunit
VTEGLAALEAAARGDANLIEPVIRAAEAGATLGEMMDLLVSEFGEYRESFSA